MYTHILNISVTFLHRHPQTWIPLKNRFGPCLFFLSVKPKARLRSVSVWNFRGALEKSTFLVLRQSRLCSHTWLSHQLVFIDTHNVLRQLSKTALRRVFGHNLIHRRFWWVLNESGGHRSVVLYTMVEWHIVFTNTFALLELCDRLFQLAVLLPQLFNLVFELIIILPLLNLTKQLLYKLRFIHFLWHFVLNFGQTFLLVRNAGGSGFRPFWRLLWGRRLYRVYRLLYRLL